MANNNYLLDTQVFIWWMAKSKRLSKDLYNLINDSNNKILLSVASVWEIIIKKTKKKLRVPGNIENSLIISGFEILPIEIPHVLELEKLPLHHKDPFDRMIISQALVENAKIITSDQKIWKYKVNMIKA